MIVRLKRREAEQRAGDQGVKQRRRQTRERDEPRPARGLVSGLEGLRLPDSGGVAAQRVGLGHG